MKAWRPKRESLDSMPGSAVGTGGDNCGVFHRSKEDWLRPSQKEKAASGGGGVACDGWSFTGARDDEEAICENSTWLR